MITKEEFQQNLSVSYKSFFNNECWPIIENYLPCLVKLGEIFIELLKEESASPILIIQPLKYIETVNVLYSNPNNKVFSVESRRFWKKSNARPTSDKLAHSIEASFQNHLFCDSLLPIILQNLQLNNEHLYSICQLLVIEAVLVIVTMPVVDSIFDNMEMPFYPCFERHVTFSTINNKSIFSKKEFEFMEMKLEEHPNLIFKFTFTPSLDRFQIINLIYFIGNNTSTDLDVLKWFKNGLYWNFDELSIKLENERRFFGITFCFSDLAINSLSIHVDIISRIFYLVSIYLSDLVQNVSYTMSALTVDSKKKSQVVNIDQMPLEIDISSWVENFLKKIIINEKREDISEITPIKEVEIANIPLKEMNENSTLSKRKVINKMNTDKFKETTKNVMKSFQLNGSADRLNVTANNGTDSQLQSPLHDNEVTPFDLRRSTFHTLDNVVDGNFMSSADEQSYLVQIANSYVATIFTQAAVELISLQFDDQHKSLNRDPLVVAAQRDIMSISANLSNMIQTGDYQTSGRVVLSVANAVQRAIKRKDQYNNPTRSKLCIII